MPRIQTADVRRAAERYFGVSEAELLSHRRAPSIEFARTVAMYVALKKTTAPRALVCSAFNRDSKATSRLVKRVNRRIAAGDARLAQAIRGLSASLAA